MVKLMYELFDEKEAKYGNRHNDDDFDDRRTMKELKSDLRKAIARM